MTNSIRVFESFILKLEEIFIALSLAALVFFQILQVFFRYVLSSPLGWIDETSKFLLIWMVMIGSAYAVQKMAHFHVDFLVEKFSVGMNKVANVIVTIFSIIFIVILIVSSFQYLQDTKGKVSAAMGVPIEIINFAIPVGFTLMAIHLVFNIILKNKGEEIPME